MSGSFRARRRAAEDDAGKLAQILNEKAAEIFGEGVGVGGVEAAMREELTREYGEAPDAELVRRLQADPYGDEMRSRYRGWMNTLADARSVLESLGHSGTLEEVPVRREAAATAAQRTLSMFPARRPGLNVEETAQRYHARVEDAADADDPARSGEDAALATGRELDPHGVVEGLEPQPGDDYATRREKEKLFQRACTLPDEKKPATLSDGRLIESLSDEETKTALERLYAGLPDSEPAPADPGGEGAA